MPIIDSGMLASLTSAAPATKLIDALSTGPVQAYSTRKLRAAYAGSAIRVRRSSDNTEQDIGFTGAGNLDESALTTFVGGGSGFIRTWYDQTTNARNLTQATAGNQPRIVNSGTVDKVNGRPVAVFDGSTSRLNGVTSVTGTTMTGNMVAYTTSSGQNAARMLVISDTGIDWDNALHASLFAQVAWDATLVSYRAGGGVGQKAVTFSQLGVWTSVYDATNHTMRVDGSAGTPVASTGTFTCDQYDVGAMMEGTPTAHFNGVIGEITAFVIGVSGSDLTTLEANQKTYFGTP